MISKNSFTVLYREQEYTITWAKKKGNKNITLTYLDNFHSRLSTPYHTPYETAYEAAYKLLPKVLWKIQTKCQKSQALYLDLPNFIFCLFGKPLNLNEIIPDLNSKEWTTNINYRKQYFKYLNYYLLNRGQNLFLVRLKTWFQLMKFECELPTVEFKWLKSKWGSYNKVNHHLIFNTKLLCFPLPIIDLIIVHELVHLVHYHHQKSFYQLLEYYLPNYTKLESELIAFV